MSFREFRVAVRAMALAIVASFVMPAAATAADAELLTTRTVKRAFAEVRDDLNNAIINKGLKVDLNGKIGDMLKRTAADIGAKGELYSEAEYFTFCSAQLSRAMMDADPLNMGLCPYVMFLYKRTGSDDITVGYKAMPIRGNDGSKIALEKINALLDAILKETTQ